MTKRNLFWGLIILFITYSCKQEFDPYERPDWLEGRVYTQVKIEDDLSTFARCIELVHYDSIIDVSGSYTVFAPTNDAFKDYFTNNPKYNSVDDIPLSELEELVKYHILQNPWSRDQLRSLDVGGWIDPDDEYNDEPRGFKRETLLLKDDRKVGVETSPDDPDELIVVDTTQSTWHRRVITDSRKYAPVFYQEYFNLYNLQLSDYAYYFDRDFEYPDDIYYVNARVLNDTIPAENGFVYKIDRVVEPPLSANEILGQKEGNYNYSKFYDLVNLFPEFSYNESETFDQAGADQGLQVDSLFDLSFPDLEFNIHNEKTKAPQGKGFSGEVTIRFHHGLVAPTNDAYSEFVQQYIEGPDQWGKMENVPLRIKKIIANSYFSQDPIYETDFGSGFKNGEDDIIHLEAGSIIDKQFASNCTFLGVDKAIVPRAFQSVIGPIYRQPKYSTMMNAIEYSGLTTALKRENQEYGLFTINNATLRADSTLLHTRVKIRDVEREYFYAMMLAPAEQGWIFSKTDIRTLLLNQVTTELPKGIASKEFLKTLAGNYLIWDNTNGTVQGTEKSVFGFQGTTEVENTPIQVSTDADNGETFQTQAWFQFSTNSIFSTIKSDYPHFQALLEKANLAKERENTYSFLSASKLYTVFVPSEEALNEIQADTLEGKALEDFLTLHFVQDNLIFTDGKLMSGYYTTARVIPVEGTSRTKNAEIYIEPGIDQISIRNASGANLTTAFESENTNKIASKQLNTDEIDSEDEIIPNTITTGVIHQIDKPLQLNTVDIR